MKKPLQIFWALLIALSLMGCATKKEKVEEPVVNNEVPQDHVVNEPVTEGTNNTVTNNHDNQTRLEVADEAAKRVTELDEVNTATVIVTDQNAYVAAVLRDTKIKEVTRDLEDKIAAKVKEADKDIKNVYVSLNPDFVERMTGYQKKINEGKPVEGLFDEFTEAVRRVFPNAH